MPAASLDTPIGRITVVERDGMIASLSWRHGADGAPTPLLAEAIAQLGAYFAKRRRDFDLPLHPAATTEAQAARDAMRAIPYGATATYGALAAQTGSSPRAFGQACGANPLPIIVPCHRVVGSDGSFGFYSGGDGPRTRTGCWRTKARRCCRREDVGERIEIKAIDGSGSFGGYLALPAEGGHAPAIVVVQEIFGVNAGIRQMCDEWAAQGYVALAPDLFWRIEPGIELTDKSEAEWKRAFELFGLFDVDKGIADIEASLRAVRARAECNGKAGVVGYCLGGLLAYLTATRTDSDATVSYYGVGIQDRLGESHAIAKPLMLHIAKQDKFVPPEAQAQIHEGLAGNAHVTLHGYDADHAFARIDGGSRVEACAREADARTAAFFREHLA